MGFSQITIIIIAAIVLAIGIGLRLFVSRRRFYRRNQAGLQRFKNYRSAIGISFVERLLMLVGNLLIIIGTLSLILGVFIGE